MSCAKCARGNPNACWYVDCPRHAERDERAWWAQMLAELSERFTLSYIAEEIGVSERQVSNWKNGERPKGLNALRLYLFHGKHRTVVQ